eukprot:1512049-Prymnesium_polylepis.1
MRQPSPFEVVRYHSLVVERSSLPPCLRETATAADGCLMALAHTSRPLYGVQFHPESICTAHGGALLSNFLSIASAHYPCPRAPSPHETLPHAPSPHAPLAPATLSAG